MQFTKLRLAGFKSFVDFVEFEIEPGVTGIVGPNGCGKSNLVEALKWVMGETSAKQVRGNEMDDVIFSGTTNRPSRNIAEVVLELDNSDRTAPARFNDLTAIDVARRIVREKGSTYKVNSKEVRARDVHLLFADQASGARSTALVSQGQISEVILAKPTDRRKLLEEAAGITGLHSRRHEAELRLRGAETNLERLEDILISLDTQMQNLRKQVRQATRYRNLNDHIRQAQATYFTIQWNTASTQLENTLNSLKESEQQVAEMTAEASSASTKQLEAASCLPRQRQEDAEAAAALQRLIMARENLKEEENRLDTVREETETRLSQISQDLEREQKLILDCTDAIIRLERDNKTLKEGDEQSNFLEKALLRLREAQKSFEHLDGEATAGIKRLATDDTQRESLIVRRSEIEARLKHLRHEQITFSDEIKGLEENGTETQSLSEKTAELDSAKANMEELRNFLVTADSQRQEAMQHLNTLQNEAHKVSSTAAELEAKERALSQLLETSDQDLWPPLVDSLAVKTGYEGALGAALGDDLSAPSDEAAPVHWSALPNYDKIPPLPAGVRPLSDYVSGSSALDRRLSQVGVIKNSKNGRKLAEQLLQGQRIVALDGGFWRWDGYTATSDAQAAATVRLEQRNHLKNIRGQLKSAKLKSLQVKQKLEEAKNKADLVIHQESAAREAAWNADQKYLELQNMQIEKRQKTLEINTRLSIRVEAETRVVNEIKAAETNLDAIVSDLNSLTDSRILRNEVESLQRKANAARTVLTEAQSKYDSLNLQATERCERMQVLIDELTAWKERQTGAETQIQQLKNRHKDLLATQARVSARPGEINSQHVELLEKIETAETLRKSLADQLLISEEKLTKADSNLKLAEGRLAQKREERVRAESTSNQAKQSLEALIERIGDKLNCVPEDLEGIADIKNDTPLPEIEVAEKRLERLERERENMGPVNLRAEVESQELSKQIETLNKEKEDLLKAIGKLRRGINELNREGRQRFVSSFTEVNKHFGELFTRLFGGGRAFLNLTDSDDPLEAGIEIMASPPGKKLQILSLLSGGEQALTALALLFGVFLTNPAPICVLDEVDASLDDHNVDHFCTLVEEMAHSLSTRFIVVTHHRMTMARMDRLYGVTMGERGVSQLVSVDLGEAVELRDIA